MVLLFLITGIFYQIIIRQIKYLNNGVEQDHRGIKRITKAMMGFKAFASAEATIAGIELHRMLKKGQHHEYNSGLNILPLYWHCILHKVYALS